LWCGEQKIGETRKIQKIIAGKPECKGTLEESVDERTTLGRILHI
jgi:hypothetical protein